jgi:hypothetical protein
MSCFNELCLLRVVSGNWEGEKCQALAKHEYKLVLVHEMIVVVNCPLLQHADNIIKKSLRSIFGDKKSVLDMGGYFLCISQNIINQKTCLPI